MLRGCGERSVSRRRDIGMAADHEALTAVSTEGIGDADSALALAAGGSELEVALRAEVISRLKLGGTLRAADRERLAKQEVNNESDGAGHEDHQHRPQSDIHSATARIARDIPNHQREERNYDSPGEAPEKTKAEGRHVVLMLVEVDVHDILDRGKKQCREHDRPHRDQANLFSDLGLLFVHVLNNLYCFRFDVQGLQPLLRSDFRHD